jgi:P-type Cu+ transporter
MIGVGIAAQHGIVSNGGGEAFQTISSLNTVVLDKTGTLTTSKFTVSDHKLFVDGSSHGLIFSMLHVAEQASTHPLAVGMRDWCNGRLAEVSNPATVDLVSSEEIPGRGLLAVLKVEGYKIEVAIGNEKLMDDVHAAWRQASAKDDLLGWKMAGKSVVVLSARLIAESPPTMVHFPVTANIHTVLGVFGVHDPPRAEASTLIAELRQLHMDVWMISGDNPITANTVAQSVGIDKSHVIAGALPKDKQTWVKQLQTGEHRSEEAHSKGWWRGKSTKRTIVAFCGDGINDAPAIAQADVGLAMGGGSNVAVSTADFCLLSSNLLSILTVHHLARATRRKIVTNFVWACVYNVALMPLAAGAFYSLGRTTLPPVWGSAAMALSSISVVVNSLFLRWLYNPPRAVRKWTRGNDV